MKVNFRYDSRYDSAKKQAIQETVEYILEKDYGETISFNVLGKMLNYNIYDEVEFQRLRALMAKIKNFLIDYGYVLKPVVGIGYYILKPKQISGYCYHTYIRKTTSLLDKSNRILTHTEKDILSDERKEEYNNVLQLNTDANKVINACIDNSVYISNKNYYDSLED